MCRACTLQLWQIQFVMRGHSYELVFAASIGKNQWQSATETGGTQLLGANDG